MSSNINPPIKTNQSWSVGAANNDEQPVAQSVMRYPSIDDLPSAQDFIGVAQVAGAQAVSDGKHLRFLQGKSLIAPLARYDVGRYASATKDQVDLIDFTSATWTYSVGAGVTASPVTTHAKEFNNTMRIACPNTSGVNGQARATVPGGNIDLSNFDYIEVSVFSEQYTYNSPTFCNIYLFTNYSADYYWSNVRIYKPGWNIVRIAKSAFTPGGSPNWNSIKVVRLQNSSSTTGYRTVYFASIKGVSAANKRAVVSLGFDDGLLDSILAGSLAAQRGIRMTFFVMPWKVGATGRMTHAQIEQLQKMGHEIAMHGPNSQSTWLDELNSVGYDEFVARMIDNRATAEQHGWDYECGSYPQGIYDDVITSIGTGNVYSALRESGMRYVRGTNNGESDTANHAQYSNIYPKSGMYIAGGLSLNNANNLAAIKAHIDNTVNLGGWQNIYGHALDATATDNITWAVSDYKEFLDYIVTKRDAGVIDCRPLGEIARDLTSFGYLIQGIED